MAGQILKGKWSRRRVTAMRRLVCLLLIGSIYSCPVFTRQDGPGHLSGIVISENGTPIGGVRIFAWHDVTTDAEGRFDLPSPLSKESVVYFQKVGFRPKALVVKPGTIPLRVVLEDDMKTAWLIPTCLTKDVRTSPEGYELNYLIPKNAKVRKIKDIDYQKFLISFAKERTSLELWWGPLVNAGPDALILWSASFGERSIHGGAGGIIGYDRRGRTPDGMVWRSADFPGLSGTAIYEGVSEEAATAYDRIIDTACQLNRSR